MKPICPVKLISVTFRIWIINVAGHHWFVVLVPTSEFKVTS